MNANYWRSERMNCRATAPVAEISWQAIRPFGCRSGQAACPTMSERGDPAMAGPRLQRFKNARPHTPTSGDASRAIHVRPSGPSRPAAAALARYGMPGMKLRVSPRNALVPDQHLGHSIGGAAVLPRTRAGSRAGCRNWRTVGGTRGHSGWPSFVRVTRRPAANLAAMHLCCPAIGCLAPIVPL